MQEASDCCAWPVAVPTRILAAARSTLVTGAPVLNYQPLAPASTIAVSMRALSIAALALAIRLIANVAPTWPSICILRARLGGHLGIGRTRLRRCLVQEGGGYMEDILLQ